MRNPDEAILLGRRVRPASPFRAMHQALRIALYEEYAGRAFCARMVEAFGDRQPFAAAAKIAGTRVAGLAALSQGLGVPCPLDTWPQRLALCPTWLENCQRATECEAAKAYLYDSLQPHAGLPEVAERFAALQRESVEVLVPRFQQALVEAWEQDRRHAAQGVEPGQAQIRHGPLGDLLERAFATLGGEHQALQAIGPMMRRLPPSLLAGVAVGCLGMLTLRRRTPPPPTPSPES